MKTYHVKKKQILLAVLGALSAFSQTPLAHATDTTISTSVTSTPNLSGNGDTLTVTSSGTLSGTGTKVTVSNNATITNSGAITSSNNRAIRLNATGYTLTVTNNAGATISSSDDAVQIQAGSSVVFNNYGTVSSSANRALNLRDTASGGSTIYNYTGGALLSTGGDAVRPGVNGLVYNDGTIKTTATGSSDGIDVQYNSGVTIVNAAAIGGEVIGASLIEGARHGITGGAACDDDTDATTCGAYVNVSAATGPLTTDGTFTMNITNNAGGTIKGDDGSGINIDGWNEKEVVTITNYGLIEGNGVSGDGDGVDVDGLVILNNYGTIVSNSAFNDVSDGVSVGGGTINNYAGGVIEGKNPGGASRGIVIVGIDKDPLTSAAIDPPQGIYANTTVDNAGLIKGDTGSGIALTGAATAFTVTITNEASGTIEGGGADAVISTTYQNITVINYGTIQADGTGKAIDFGSSDSDLQILGGAAHITGDIDGGTGTSTLEITPGAGNSFVYAGSISNFAGGVTLGAGTSTLSGTISSNVTNAGILQPGTATTSDTLTIDGNYMQSTGTLLINVDNGASPTGSASDAGYSHLVVNGTATVTGGTVELKPTGTYAFAAGQRFLVIDANAGSSYSGLTYSANGYTGTVTGQLVNDGDLEVDIAGTSAASGLATTANASSALAGLANYTGTDPALLNLYNAAAALTSDEATSAGAQLAPTQSNTSNPAFTSATTDAANMINLHLNNIHSNAGIAGGDGAANASAWVEGFGGNAHQAERDDVDGYKGNYGGLLLGVDKTNGDWTIGGAFAYSHAKVSNTGNTSDDNVTVNSYGIFGYASYDARIWYANWTVGAVEQNSDSHRAIDVSGVSGSADGSYKGQQYIVRGEAGIPFAVASVTVAPIAGLSYLHVKQDSYTESSDIGAALAVNATSSNSLRSNLGVDISKRLETSIGTVTPELRAQWLHEFKDDRVATSASFAADPTGATAFTTLGQTPTSNLADLWIGATLVKSDVWSFSARYELQKGSGFTSNNGNLRVQYKF